MFNHTNKEKLQVNWLPSPVPTAYIRVFPVKGRCLKLDVYGCDGGRLMTEIARAKIKTEIVHYEVIKKKKEKENKTK